MLGGYHVLLQYLKHYTITELPNARNIVSDMIFFADSYFHFDEENQYRIHLVLSELIANGFVHGNHMLRGKKVHVWLKIILPDTIKLLVIDEGNGFNLITRIKYLDNDSTCPIDRVLENGRGIQLVSSFCEQIRYNKKGNKVIAVITL